MPPLKGIDRGLNGEALKALEELGHGNQIAVVDPSYPIPRDAEVVDYNGSERGNTTDQAVNAILRLVPIEADESGTYVNIMRPDEGEVKEKREWLAAEAIAKVALDQGLSHTFQLRYGDKDSHQYNGFYADANDPKVRTLFVRTRDQRAFACARVIVGHSQGLEVDTNGNTEDMGSVPLDELSIGTRAYNMLKRAGINNLEILLSKSKRELLEVPDFGKRSLQEVEEALGEKGLALRGQSTARGWDGSY